MSTTTSTQPRRGLRWLAALMFAVFAVTLTAGIMSLDGPSDPSKASANLGGVTSSSVSSTPAPTAKNCPPGTSPAKFVLGANYEVIKGGLPADDIIKAKEVMLEAAETNPVFVVGYALERKIITDYIDAKTLTKDNCWTPEGYKLSLQVQGVLKSGSAVYATADPSRRNSGGEDGKLVVAETPGLNGDLLSVRIYYPDGSFTEVLVRCSNFTFEGDVPEIPRGKTDNPPPPTSPLPPAPECPPGHVGTPPDNCIERKVTEQQPENRGNIPGQLQPGGQKQTPNPTHAQPVEPANPPPVYVEPTQPPVATSPRPAPPSNEGPPAPAPAPPGDPCMADPTLPACG